MNEQLILNGVLVDLAAPNSIAITYQANTLGALQGREGDFSNVFVLPKSPTNRAFFESSDNVNSATNIPYSRMSAKYIVDGVQRVQDGSARLIRTTAQGFEVQVVSGNTSFFGKFPDLKVSELIGSSLDHINNFTNVVGSRANTEGYIYPLIDWNDSSDETAFLTDEIDARRLLPCVFVKDIFKLVDEYTGYNSYGDLIDLPDFQNMVLTPNALQRGQAAKDQYNASAEVTTPQTVLVGVDNSAFTIVNYVPTMGEFSGNFTGSTFSADAGLYGYFVFSGGVEYKYKRYSAISRNVEVKAQIIRDSDGAIIEEEILFSELTAFDPAELEQTVILPFNVITSNITFTAGELYHVNFKITDPNKSELLITDTVKFSFSLEANIPYNGFMPVGELYEGITVKQLYQDVLNIFAGVPLTNSFQRRVRLGLFNELNENITKAKDWSDKLDGEDNSLEFTFGKYGRTNLLKYAPQDGVTEFYGDSSFSIDDDNLVDTVTAIQLKTSATEDETRYQAQLYPRIKALDSNRQLSPQNYRLLILDRRNTSYPHTYDDGATSSAVSTSIPYVTFRPLFWSELIDNYYGGLLGMLRKTKAPAYRFKLSQVDVQELDYLTPIKLSVHRGELNVSGYFYINQVANYVNGFASVSLVRL